MTEKPEPRFSEANFEKVFDQLAISVAEHAQKLKGPANFSIKLDALKVLTAYKSVKNRAPEPDDGSEINRMRDELLADDGPPRDDEPLDGDEAPNDEPIDETPAEPAVAEAEAGAPVPPVPTRSNGHGYSEWRAPDANQS